MNAARNSDCHAARRLPSAAAEDPALPLLPGAALAVWANGTWDGPPVDVRGVSQDGRQMPRGGLYVALPGERHDGHVFVGQAAAADAAAALVSHDWPRPPDLALPLLRVADPLAALTAVAAAWRRVCGARVLGVTGSAGKTTTKELAAAMLGAFAPTAATPGNWNNAIGLPLSLLALPAGVRFAVIEAGTNHPGEIAALAETMQPDAAIVTAIGPAHIEFFGSVAAIAKEKADLPRRVPRSGFVVLDADGAYCDFLRRQTGARAITVSLADSVAADYVGRLTDPLTGDLVVIERATGEARPLRSGLPGRHNAVNLLQAVAAARALGATWEAIAVGVSAVRLPPMRWERFEAGGRSVINDAYNANSLGMRCALETFATLAVAGRRVLVLGDMRELGAASEALHRDVGRALAGGPWDLLVTVGACAHWLADEAVATGFPAARVLRYADATQAAVEAGGWSRPGDTILLKASRGIGLERVATALQHPNP